MSKIIQAQQPSAVSTHPFEDGILQQIDLTGTLVQHPDHTLLVECLGDSMLNAFIPPKAKLLVDRAVTAQNGDIVLARINGEFTVKYLKKNAVRCWLVPANSKYRDMEITPEMNFQVWGVVICVITDAKDLRRCML